MCNPRSSWCDDDRCLKQGAFRDVHPSGDAAADDRVDDVFGWSIAVILKDMLMSGTSPTESRRRWRCLLDAPSDDSYDTSDDDDGSETDAERGEEEDALARFADFDDDVPSSSDVETNDRGGRRDEEKPFVRYV